MFSLCLCLGAFILRWRKHITWILFKRVGLLVEDGRGVPAQDSIHPLSPPICLFLQLIIIDYCWLAIGFRFCLSVMEGRSHNILFPLLFLLSLFFFRIFTSILSSPDLGLFVVHQIPYCLKLFMHHSFSHFVFSSLTKLTRKNDPNVVLNHRL